MQAVGADRRCCCTPDHCLSPAACAPPFASFPPSSSCACLRSQPLPFLALAPAAPQVLLPGRGAGPGGDLAGAPRHQPGAAARCRLQGHAHFPGVLPDTAPGGWVGGRCGCGVGLCESRSDESRRRESRGDKWAAFCQRAVYSSWPPGQLLTNQFTSLLPSPSHPFSLSTSSCTTP
jgi:hypothetical protein